MQPPFKEHPLAIRRFENSAFSLVEVVLAVGVVAFAFVGILGLLPAGMSQFRGSIDASVCAQIAQKVIADARQTDFDTLVDKVNLPDESGDFAFRAPKIAQPEFRYFDERGSEVVPSTASARSNPVSLTASESALIVYHVLVRVMPQTPLSGTTGNAKGGRQLATVTVQVANNPGNRALKISSAGKSDGSDATRQLFANTPGVSVLTYSAQIARNQ